MRRMTLAPCVLCVALLVSCAPQPQPVATEPPTVPIPAVPVAPKAAVAVPRTIDAYKILCAQRIAAASTATFDEPVPPMLKSVVVLELTIDREGRLARVSVYRSNGYAALENIALDSVRRASPFASPASVTRERSGSVTFLETFLFREDGRFRIRSLVDQRP